MLQAERRFDGGGNSVEARPLNLSLAMNCSIALAEERGALSKFGPLMVTPTGRILNGLGPFWLLLRAASHSGTLQFLLATSIGRLHTTGRYVLNGVWRPKSSLSSPARLHLPVVSVKASPRTS